MQPTPFNRNLARVYLFLVPFIGSALAFIIGHVSYKIYLPVWIINILLMICASWVLGLRQIRSGDAEKKQLLMGAFFLIIPFMLLSMFAGLGPPPETAEEWIRTATEQQVRYFMLVIAGIFVAFAFVILNGLMKINGEKFFSAVSKTAIIIAIPLFIINMLFWGFYLPELFYIQVSSATEKLPEWSLPVRKLFGLVSVVEVALTYLATSFFAISLNKNGWLNKTGSRIYVVLSLVGFLIIMLSAFLPGPVQEIGNILSIPAFPLLMPYFIGIGLLHKTGN